LSLFPARDFSEAHRLFRRGKEFPDPGLDHQQGIRLNASIRAEITIVGVTVT